MDQLTFGDADFAGKGKLTRKERFLAEMNRNAALRAYVAQVCEQVMG